ncbi:uncharacterized protein LOC126981898 [Eriocheir sinensis]|uniref:uncharacterized protein LOC126981898 n=1 Tax=Eriocheir sinensis TaxID=95602 RepID=UPI0021C77C53|nr:uncharacterized protein LOC126981898 [Eriocheir sinensis]
MGNTGKEWLWWCLVVAVAAAAVEGQRTKKCDMKPSVDSPDKMDVHCNCMQRLEKVDVAVASLTINQTGCARARLELSWPTLEAEVGPELLVLEGARVTFAEDGAAAPWQPSITAITFINCNFLEVPSHAFRGLQLLEKVRLVGGAAGAVRGGAFSDLPLLRVVEVANASLALVESGAWARLPALTHLALWHSSLGELKPHAVNLSRGSGGPVGHSNEACGEVREVDDDRDRVLDVLSGRSGPGDDKNLSLPQFGTQLLLFHNHIEVLGPQAITGDAFGFLIMGSNEVGHVGGAALDLALNNPCEISAAMLVDNTLGRLEDGALEGLRGWPGAPRHTFLALTNNTFSSVAPRAFTLHRDVHVFSAGQNRFRCRCQDLLWAMPAAAEGRRDLQEALLGKGLCQDGTNLAAFTAACTKILRPPSPSIIPPPPPTTAPHDHTTPALSPSSSPTTTQPSSHFPSPSTTPPPSHDSTVSPPTSTQTPKPEPSGAAPLTLAPTAFITLLLARTLL